MISIFRRKAPAQTAAPLACAEHPAVVQALLAEGARVERERIRTIYKAELIEGHEALVTALMFDGISTVADVAIAVLQAERQRLSTQCLPPLLTPHGRVLAAVH